MHDISLQSHINKMDAHNLTIVLCPNLVRSANPMRDVQMCAIQSGSSISSSNALRSTDSVEAIGSQKKLHEDRDKTTLGMIIKLCIERYWEIFDDAANPVASSSHVRTLHSQTSRVSSHHLSPEITLSPGPQSTLPTHLTVAEGDGEGDEDIDDTMLVMPIEPSPGLGKYRSDAPVSWAEGVQRTRLPGVPPTTASGSISRLSTRTNNIQIPNLISSDSSSPSRSTYSPSANDTVTPYPTYSKARSFFSNQGGMSGTNPRRGPISVGKGVVRKSRGSGVESMGITAEGFFAPPSAFPHEENDTNSASQ